MLLISKCSLCDSVSKHLAHIVHNEADRAGDSWTTVVNMPALRTSKNRKPPPDGFDDIEDTLLEFQNKMKDAENASSEGKKKHEMLWPVFQITHQRKLNPLTATHIFPILTFYAQAPATSTTSTMKKKPSANRSTTGYSRTITPTQT